MESYNIGVYILSAWIVIVISFVSISWIYEIFHRRNSNMQDELKFWKSQYLRLRYTGKDSVVEEIKTKRLWDEKYLDEIISAEKQYKKNLNTA